MTTDRKGTVTGRLTTSEPTFQELPPRDPWGWDGTVRARVADAFRRGDYTSTPGEPLAAALGAYSAPERASWHYPSRARLRGPQAARWTWTTATSRSASWRTCSASRGWCRPKPGRPWGCCPWDYFKPGRNLG